MCPRVFNVSVCYSCERPGSDPGPHEARGLTEGAGRAARRGRCHQEEVEN